MRRTVTTALLIAATAVAAADTLVQPARCGARDRIVDELERRYGETRRALGIAGEQRLVEIFASERGSWTILLTDPRGRSCLMATGQDFHATQPQERQEPPGDPA